MSELDLLIDLHLTAARQGPGGEAETNLAMQLAGLGNNRPLKIADIGCGTGASTLQLAGSLDATIVAADLFPRFLAQLQKRAAQHNLADRIQSLEGSMDSLPFQDEEFDVIWSEGAVYCMGFEAGISAWKRFLKPGGKLVVSEITWLTAERPDEIHSHWINEYPEIDVASAKFDVLERHGYRPEAYFTLPERCWLDNYYKPMQAKFDAFLKRWDFSEAAQAIVAAEQEEIALYEKFRDFYSYGMYVASKI